MEVKELIQRPGIQHNKKLAHAYDQFNTLLIELRKKELSDESMIFINKEIDEVNSIPNSEKTLKKKLRTTQSTILRTIEKQYKIVTINHYRNIWIALGMSVFGVPFGVAVGTSLGNMAFLGIGIPMGMVIGMAIGSSMDKKAFEEGRQLPLEIKSK